MFALECAQLNTVSQPKNKLYSNVLKNTALDFKFVALLRENKLKNFFSSFE
jgi:hypothetical protein